MTENEIKELNNEFVDKETALLDCMYLDFLKNTKILMPVKIKSILSIGGKRSTKINFDQNYTKDKVSILILLNGYSDIKKYISSETNKYFVFSNKINFLNKLIEHKIKENKNETRIN